MASNYFIWCRSITRRSLLPTLCFFLASSCLASPFNYHSYQYFGIEHGLPGHTVFSVKQDAFGFIWVGTSSGIGILGGNSIKQYNQISVKTRQFPLINPGILFVANNNRIFAGSWGQGVATILEDRDQFIHFVPDPDTDTTPKKVQTFLQTSDKTIWLGSANAGLFYLDPKRNEFVSVREQFDRTDLHQLRIWDLVESSDGNLWVGTSNGLRFINRNEKRVISYLDTASTTIVNQQVRTLLYLNDELWIGTRGRFGQFDQFTQKFTTYVPSGYEDLVVNQLAHDGNSGIWLATSFGLFHFDLWSRQFSRTKEGAVNVFSQEDMRDLHVSKEGLLWIATRESGLIKLDFRKPLFSQFSPDVNQDARKSNISNLQMDHNSILWMATGNGIVFFDAESNKFVPGPDEINANITQRVYGTAHNKMGDVYIATQTTLFKFIRQTGELIKLDNVLNANEITELSTIYLDSNEHVWIGVSEMGVFEMANDTLINHYQHDPNKASLSGSQVIKITEDAHGNIWAGTLGNGLSVKKKGEKDFKPFIYEIEDGSEYFDDVVQDFILSKDTIWLATHNGLARINIETKRAKLITINHGLVSNEIKSLVEDNSGYIWLGIGKTVSRLNPETLEIQNYSRTDGIVDNNFVGKSILVDQKGDLFIGGDRGFNLLKSGADKDVSSATPVFVKDVWLNDSRIDEVVIGKSQITMALNHEEKNLKIKFGSLDYRAGQAKPLLYQLEGFESKWHVSDLSQTATYTNLDPGDYLFRVRDSANGLVGEGEEAVIKIKITPPIWQNLWFQFALMFISILVLYGAFRWRVDRLEKAQLVLERRVDQRTQELAQKNTELVEAYRVLEEISLTDQLTGLKNRRFLIQYLEDEIQLSLRKYTKSANKIDKITEDADLIFILIDLDHFKSVNDTYGHDAGDKVLTLIPEVIMPIFRESDFFIRWGGEEFLVVARHTNREMAPVLADRLREAFAKNQFELPDGQKIRRTASIGYACFPFDLHAIKKIKWGEVVKLADHALYAAKHGGRNNWVGIEAGINNEAIDVDKITSDTKNQIEDKVIEVKSGKEANLVWIHT